MSYFTEGPEGPGTEYCEPHDDVLVDCGRCWRERAMKAESLAAEAVAKEAARWKLVINKSIDEINNNRNIHPGAIVASLVRALNSYSSDWLAQHDASVAEKAVKPWREAVADMVENCCAHIGSRHYTEYRELLSSSAPAPLPKGDKL